jgi:hypothetical protein
MEPDSSVTPAELRDDSGLVLRPREGCAILKAREDLPPWLKGVRDSSTEAQYEEYVRRTREEACELEKELWESDAWDDRRVIASHRERSHAYGASGSGSDEGFGRDWASARNPRLSRVMRLVWFNLSEDPALRAKDRARGSVYSPGGDPEAEVHQGQLYAASEAVGVGDWLQQVVSQES